ITGGAVALAQEAEGVIRRVIPPNDLSLVINIAWRNEDRVGDRDGDEVAADAGKSALGLIEANIPPDKVAGIVDPLDHGEVCPWVIEYRENVVFKEKPVGIISIRRVISGNYPGIIDRGGES